MHPSYSPDSDSPRRVLLTTGSSDAHTWNLVHLQLFLEEHGHSVLNLGPCVPERLLVDTARMTHPDLVVLSSVNGHGHQDGLRAARALRADKRTQGIPMVIGGLLGISPEGAEQRTAELLDAGYDEVYADGTAPTALLKRLAATGGTDRGTGAPTARLRGACTGRAAA